LSSASETSLLARAKIFIQAADPDAARKFLDRVLDRDATGALTALLADDARARALLFGVFGCSPYLAELPPATPRGWRACFGAIRRRSSQDCSARLAGMALRPRSR